jgi:hypothetical protein
MLAAAGLWVFLSVFGCTQSERKEASLTSPSGRWFAFSDGRPIPVASPAAAQVSFQPWTVQTHVSGFVRLGSTIYIALNGWGLVGLAESKPESGNLDLSFETYEDRTIFGERTINGFYGGKGSLILHLYRNTVFRTAAPRSTPVTYVRFDPSGKGIEPVVLPLTREGWEAIDVIHTPRGRWAIAWKKTTAAKVGFRYSLFNPETGGERTIDRRGFLAAYGFIDVSKSSGSIRALAAAAAVGEGPPGKAVFHFLVRGGAGGRIERYRVGPEKLLASGELPLRTIPVVRTSSRLYALLSDGNVISETSRRAARKNLPTDRRGSGMVRLPLLSAGYVYTAFWTDGKLLLVSWERQRFADVGAAGIYLESLPGTGPVRVGAVRP